MDVLALRTQLQDALEDVLGDYMLANGSTTPAFSVRSEGQSAEPGTKVIGVEGVLLREPRLTPVRGYSYPGSYQDWTLCLVDWGGDGDLASAADLVLALYPDAQVETVRVPEGAGPMGQVRITVRTVL